MVLSAVVHRVGGLGGRGRIRDVLIQLVAKIANADFKLNRLALGVNHGRVSESSEQFVGASSQKRLKWAGRK